MQKCFLRLIKSQGLNYDNGGVNLQWVDDDIEMYEKNRYVYIIYSTIVYSTRIVISQFSLEVSLVQSVT